MSHQEVIYQIQQSIAENLSNVVVRNHGKTIPNKNYSVQNYVVVQESAGLLQNKHAYAYRTVFKVCSKTAKGVNLVVSIENTRVATNDVFLMFLVFTWNKSNIFRTSHWCPSKLVVPKFRKKSRMTIMI